MRDVDTFRVVTDLQENLIRTLLSQVYTLNWEMKLNIINRDEVISNSLSHIDETLVRLKELHA